MNTFYLKVIASNKTFFSGRCKSLVVPTLDGEVGILSHRENVVMAIDMGEMRITDLEDKVITAVVGTGFVQVMNNRVTVLVDTAELPEEIDIRRAQEAKERAEELRDKILEKTNVTDVMITKIGPIIGTHTGPGMLAVLFLEKE